MTEDESWDELRALVDKQQAEIDDLKPAAAKWWQVYQDQCEGAYVEATIVKELKKDIQRLKDSQELALKFLLDTRHSWNGPIHRAAKELGYEGIGK